MTQPGGRRPEPRAERFTPDLIATNVELDRLFEFVSADETGTYGDHFVLRELADGCELTRAITAGQLGIGQRALYWLTLVRVRRLALRASLSQLAAQVS